VAVLNINKTCAVACKHLAVILLDDGYQHIGKLLSTTYKAARPFDIKLCDERSDVSGRFLFFASIQHIVPRQQRLQLGIAGV